MRIDLLEGRWVVGKERISCFYIKLKKYELDYKFQEKEWNGKYSCPSKWVDIGRVTGVGINSLLDQIKKRMTDKCH